MYLLYRFSRAAFACFIAIVAISAPHLAAPLESVGTSPTGGSPNLEVAGDVCSTLMVSGVWPNHRPARRVDERAVMADK